MITARTQLAIECAEYPMFLYHPTITAELAKLVILMGCLLCLMWSAFRNYWSTSNRKTVRDTTNSSVNREVFPLTPRFRACVVLENTRGYPLVHPLSNGVRRPDWPFLKDESFTKTKLALVSNGY